MSKLAFIFLDRVRRKLEWEKISMKTVKQQDLF